MKRFGITALLLATVVGVAAPARADIDGSRYESAEWRVRLSAPRNWQLTERTSYPHVLLWMARPPDARMLLSAERIPEDETAAQYAARTATLLKSMGFALRAPQLHAATGAYWIDFNNRSVYLRQAFLVIGGVGYALTLSAPDSRRRSQHLRAFDFTLRSIRPIRETARERAAKEAAEAETAPEPNEAPPEPDSGDGPSPSPPEPGPPPVDEDR